MTAYAAHGYVATCHHLGDPVVLARSGATLLRRPLPDGGNRVDLCGAYPLFACPSWDGFAADLDDLAALDPPDRPVSVVAVLDPLDDPGPAAHDAFRDHLVGFKRHHVVELAARSPLPTGHRRNMRRASAAVTVELADDPRALADDWVRLYGELHHRHPVGPGADFDACALRAQLELPGTLTVAARRTGTVVAMATWLVDGPNAHYHLGASDRRGYEVGASFAVFSCALDELARRSVAVVDLGGSAGVVGHADGLDRFKRGWATGTRVARLGGRILDPDAYRALTAGRGPAGYFPAYRAPVAA